MGYDLHTFVGAYLEAKNELIYKDVFRKKCCDIIYNDSDLFCKKCRTKLKEVRIGADITKK